MSATWGLAFSDSCGNIQWYRSNLQNGLGVSDSSEHITGSMFDAVKDREKIMLAWAEAVTSQSEVSIRNIAIRNNREFLLTFIPIPPGVTMLTFSLWGPDADSEPLTQREVDVCEMLCDGVSPSEIASRLGLTAQMVNRNRKSAMQKLGAKTCEQLGSMFSAVYGAMPRD